MRASYRYYYIGANEVKSATEPEIEKLIYDCIGAYTEELPRVGTTRAYGGIVVTRIR